MLTRLANKPPAGRRLRLATSSKKRYEICSGRETEKERRERGEWATDSQVEKSGITRSSEQLVWLETEEALETATVDEAGGGSRGGRGGGGGGGEPGAGGRPGRSHTL